MSDENECEMANEAPATGLIHKKMAKIMREIEPVGKDKKNKTQNYNYRGIDDIYNELHEKCAANDVFMMVEDVDLQTENAQSKSEGTINAVRVCVQYRFYTTDGSYVESKVWGESRDTFDKATGKAHTNAHKTLLTQVFLLPTAEPDPDGDAPGDQARQNYEEGKKTGGLAPKTLTKEEAVKQAKEPVNGTDVKPLVKQLIAQGMTPEQLRAAMDDKIQKLSGLCDDDTAIIQIAKAHGIGLPTAEQLDDARTLYLVKTAEKKDYTKKDGKTGEMWRCDLQPLDEKKAPKGDLVRGIGIFELKDGFKAGCIIKACLKPKPGTNYINVDGKIELVE